MKNNFVEYLVSIGITKTYGKRIMEIYNFYAELCPETIEDIFVEDYITEDQSREYESLWFFSKNYIMEAKRFITEDNLDMFRANKMIRWHIKKKDYDFKEATEKSRMILTIQFEEENGSLKASKENCDYLKEIFYKYFNL